MKRYHTPKGPVHGFGVLQCTSEEHHYLEVLDCVKTQNKVRTIPKGVGTPFIQKKHVKSLLSTQV